MCRFIRKNFAVTFLAFNSRAGTIVAWLLSRHLLISYTMYTLGVQPLSVMARHQCCGSYHDRMWSAGSQQDCSTTATSLPSTCQAHQHVIKTAPAQCILATFFSFSEQLLLFIIY